MPTICTLGSLGKRTAFTYTGDTQTGVTLHFNFSTPRVSAEFFKEILHEFNGRTIPGGFSMTTPTQGGLGEWIQNNSPSLNVVRLTPRHASFISAIMVNEGLITSSLRGNAVYLHF
jgi:hypothetical protein